MDAELHLFIACMIAVFKADKTRNSTLISLNRPCDRVANIMGMKVNAVRQLIHRADTCPRSTTERPLPMTVDNFCVRAIRRFIHTQKNHRQRTYYPQHFIHATEE